MKIALVEKTKSRGNIYNDLFDFDFDRFSLTNSRKSRILKADITLDFKELDDYDYVILVGAEPAKFVGKITNLTKFTGQLKDGKYIGLVNPSIINFRPELEDTVKKSVSRIHSYINGTYHNTLGKYKGLNTEKSIINYLKDVLKNANEVVVDTETSSLYPRDGYILGIAMTHEVGKGYYLDTNYINEEAEDLLQKIFDKKLIIFHNAKFDIKMLEYHFKFRFPHWRDSMLMHYILNENEAHDLKSLILKYTDMGDYDAELEEFKYTYCRQNKVKVSEFTYDLVPWDIMKKYAGADADGTLRLYVKFRQVFEKSPNFQKLEKKIFIPGTRFLTDIEEIGVPFSKSQLLAAQDMLEEELTELKEGLYSYEEVRRLESKLTDKFNPNSTAHLRQLFFDELGFMPTKRTPKGEPSTDKEVLELLAEHHEVPKAILEIRQKTKLKSTYIDKVLLGLDNDGRLRTGFHLHTVTSGRLSSSGKLNLQQLPRDDKTVKYCIVPPYDDYVIFSQDLTTAEMYYAAAIAEDKALMDVFREGGNFHSAIAKRVFKLPCSVEEVAEKYGALRQASKAISFGILYGAGPAKIAQTAGLTIKEAREVIDQYFGTFAKLKKWLDSTGMKIRDQGYIYSEFGRKRRVPGVFSVSEEEREHAVRSAVNFTIQSVASDVNLLAGIDCHNWINENNYPAEIFMLVHDSIVGMVQKDKVDEFETIIRKFTQKSRGVGVPGCPIGVDFGYGRTYAEAG